MLIIYGGVREYPTLNALSDLISSIQSIHMHAQHIANKVENKKLQIFINRMAKNKWTKQSWYTFWFIFDDKKCIYMFFSAVLLYDFSPKQLYYYLNN